MPSMLEHASARIVKLLEVGDSGAGKTGTLASLAKVGYNLNILDFDNGLDILYQRLKDDKPALGRINYETCVDPIKQVNGTPMILKPEAFSKAMKLLDNWPGKGPLSSWGEDEVLVIDSFTFMGRACMNHTLFLNGHLNDQPTLPDWGAAMKRLEDVLAILQSDATKCNVVLICHINYVENETTGVVKGYPMALGQKLSPRVGAYFNHALLVRASGSGDKRQRSILTQGEGLIDCKSPVVGVPSTLPIETGLADYFKLVTGRVPQKKGT